MRGCDVEQDPNCRVSRSPSYARKRIFRCFFRQIAASGRTLGVEGHQSLAREHRGSPDRTAKNSCASFLATRTAVARLAVLEEILQNMKRVLDLRTDAGLELLESLHELFPIASFGSALRLPRFIAICQSAVEP